jgi:acetyl esterase
LSFAGLLKSRSTNGTYVEGVLIEDILIDSEWETDKTQIPISKIELELFLPLNSDNKKLPIMLNIHGGGWVLKGSNHRNIEFAKLLNMIVINVEYRLAPEHPFPTQIEDIYSSLLWLSKKEHPLLKYADLSRVIIHGDSAGGNLAAATCILVRDRGLPIQIKHQILIYPSIPTYTKTASREEFSNGYILSSEISNWFFYQYVTDVKHYESKYLSPLLESNFTDIPPALFIFATYDMLYDEGHFYRQHLEKHGVQTEHKDYPSVHGFYNMVKTGTHDEEAFQLIVEYLRKNNIEGSN